MCAIMYVRKIRFTSLLAFAVITPVLIASCTQPENAEASGMLKCTCHSDKEVVEVSLEDDPDLAVQLLWVGMDLVMPLTEPETVLTV